MFVVSTLYDITLFYYLVSFLYGHLCTQCVGVPLKYACLIWFISCIIDQPCLLCASIIFIHIYCSGNFLESEMKVSLGLVICKYCMAIVSYKKSVNILSATVSLFVEESLGDLV